MWSLDDVLTQLLMTCDTGQSCSANVQVQESHINTGVSCISHWLYIN